MAPEDPSLPAESPDASPDLQSDAHSGSTVPELRRLSELVASLNQRVTLLETAIADLNLPWEEPATAPPPKILATGRQPAGPPPSPVFLAHDHGKTPEPPPARSLEDRLGSQIFNRVGIVAILIGATWFLKLAMDNHWIGPLGRVLVGLIAGAGLVIWSERFRRREFAAFSYSLKAIGTGVLYLSLWASFQLYHLLPADAAFALMLLVTIWNAWMSWAQQSELLAAYALAGGFLTPLLLATGGNHQVFLFSYLFTIDLATIVLGRFMATRSRSWSRLLIAALPATIVYFIGWYSRFYTGDQLASTSLFIALFFAIFFTVPLRIRYSEAGDAPAAIPQAEAISDVLLPLLNAAFGSLAFYSVLEDSGNHAALPWVALLFAAIYLGAMRLPLLSRMQTAAARAVHLSLAVLFLTITIPLKASGRWITIGWLAEGVALLWVSARLSNADAQAETGAGVHRMLRRLASVALALGLCGLFSLPFWLDRSIHTAIFNRRFATEVAGILALAATAWISLRAMTASESAEHVAETPESTIFPTWQQLAAVSVIALNLVALQAGVAEIQTFFWVQGQASALSVEAGLQTALSISAFVMLYGAAVLAAGFWKHSAFLRWQGLLLLIFAIVKTFLYDVRDLSQGYRVASFLGLGALLMAVSFAYVRQSGKTSQDGKA